MLLPPATDDPALHPETLQEGRGEATAKEVRTHPEVPPVQPAEEPLRGHPHPARVRRLFFWMVSPGWRRFFSSALFYS